jgi:hypothetical protein
MGTRRRKALRAWNAVTLVRLRGKGPWCWPVKLDDTSVTNQCDRERQWSGHAACVRVDKAQRRLCPTREGDRDSPLSGSVGSWSQLVFAVPTATLLEVGDAACGYSAPHLRVLFQGAYEGAH